MKLVSALLVLTLASPALAEDKVAAESAFRAAKELEKAGQLAEACPLYEASYRDDPQLGALLNLANCHEHLGRTATAWVEYSDALEIATRKGDNRADYARQRLAALEPRLSRLRIEAPTGVTVERNGTDVSPLLRQDLVVDPGTYVIRATQVGKEPWETTIQIAEPGHTVRIEVPELTAPAQPAPPPALPLVATAPSLPREAPAPRRRPILALTLGTVGLGAAAVGLGFGAHARAQWATSRENCDEHNVCNEGGVEQIASARRAASVATWTTGAGVALLVAAGVAWLVSPSADESRVSIVPSVGPTGASISATARF